MGCFHLEMLPLLLRRFSSGTIDIIYFVIDVVHLLSPDKLVQMVVWKYYISYLVYTSLEMTSLKFPEITYQIKNFLNKDEAA